MIFFWFFRIFHFARPVTSYQPVTHVSTLLCHFDINTKDTIDFACFESVEILPPRIKVLMIKPERGAKYLYYFEAGKSETEFTKIEANINY